MKLARKPENGTSVWNKRTRKDGIIWQKEGSVGYAIFQNTGGTYMARNMITGRETQKMQEYTQEQINQAERRGRRISNRCKRTDF